MGIVVGNTNEPPFVKGVGGFPPYGMEPILNLRKWDGVGFQQIEEAWTKRHGNLPSGSGLVNQRS